MDLSRIPAEWLRPDWPAPSGVHAVCTTRPGGCSQGAYGELNLGDHVGDDSAAVARNRAVLQRSIAARPFFLHQVHGCVTVQLDSDSAPGQTADASMTRSAGLACTIMVADCLPMLCTDTQGTLVGAAHAGWRGLAGGVIESLITATRASSGSLMFWLGPCIGPRSFEVGADVVQAFVADDPEATACFRDGRVAGKWWADLPALARRRLKRLGVTAIYGNDGADDWCTVKQPSRFFSHRRDGICGRFAASIWRE